MQIEKVMGGVNGDTTAQAIQLRMRRGAQNFVSGTRMWAYDAAGKNRVLLIDFGANVANGSLGDRVLIASPNFANYTNVPLSPDFTLASLIPSAYLAAGRITFERETEGILWSLCFGGAAYTGSTKGRTDNDADGNFGPCFDGLLPSGALQGLKFQGSAFAPSTNNAADYTLTSGAALFTNNARASVMVIPKPAIPKGSQVIELQPVVTGLTAPVQVTHAGDSRLLVVNQVGQIQIVQDGALLPTPFLDIAAKVVSLNPNYDERGLLGMAFHPNYAGNGKFYVYYNAPPATLGFDNRSIISELTVSADPNLADPTSERVVLTFDQPQSTHNGGQLAFGPDDGYLYISSGDGGNANDAGPHHTPVIGNAQDTTNLLGKILRIDVDNRDPGLQYAIPATNPFAGSATDRREIYAYGLRNPYRFSFDAGGTHRLFVGDVGQNAVEEVDIITKGGNYGWKAKEGTQVFDPSLPQAGYIDPIAEYTHADGVAVIGGFVYRGSVIPSLQGKYVFGDLVNSLTGNGRLFYLEEGPPNAFQLFEFRIGLDDHPLGPLYVKGFGEDVNGELYVLVDSNVGPSGSSGQLLRIVNVPPIAPLTIGASVVLPEGEVRVVYRDSLGISGGLPPYIVSVKGPLPLGLTLSPEGILAGAPAVARISSFTVVVADQQGSSVSKRFGIKIFKALAITTRSLRKGKAGKRYIATLQAMGGKKPYAWSLTSGSLPGGLDLDPSKGKLTGTPTASGSFDLIFQVTDPLGGAVQKSLTLTIDGLNPADRSQIHRKSPCRDLVANLF